MTTTAQRPPAGGIANTARPRYRVGLDLDGVCYDFAGAVRAWLTMQGHPVEAMPPATRWEFYLDWGLDLREFLDVCHAGVDAGHIFWIGDPYPGVQAAVASILEAGHEVHVVTDRSFGTAGASESATRAWLKEHDLNVTSLTFSADKTCVPVDCFIDDRDINYAALDATGVNVWLQDRPWNQHVPNARRVENLTRFADMIRAQFQRH